jgi:hypothetical protein
MPKMRSSVLMLVSIASMRSSAPARQASDTGPASVVEITCDRMSRSRWNQRSISASTSGSDA